MADVFLSYAREDRPRAAQIAEALQAGGYQVFWDVEIPPGKSWADVLADKLAQCNAAIVLWSAASTASQYVREEARLARDKGKLIPVMLDGSSPPFGFGEIQAANLEDWNGQPNHPQWKLLLEGVGLAVGRAASGPAKAAPIHAKLQSSGTGSGTGTGGGRKLPTWALIGGGALGAVALLAIVGAMLPQNPPAPGPGYVQPAVAPTPGALSPPVAGASVPAAAAAAAQRAVAAQAQARQASQSAQAASQAGQQAAAAVAAGDPRYGASQGPMGAVAGDLVALQQGRPAAVGLAMANGSQFYGTLQMDAATQRSSLSGAIAAPGGVTGSGAWAYAGDGSYEFSGAGYIPNRFTVEAHETGRGQEATGEGVICYADGTCYAGQYRTVGEGAQAQVFRHGFGVLYDATRAVKNAGRFDNDRFVGAE